MMSCDGKSINRNIIIITHHTECTLLYVGLNILQVVLMLSTLVSLAVYTTTTTTTARMDGWMECFDTGSVVVLSVFSVRSKYMCCCTTTSCVMYYQAILLTLIHCTQKTTTAPSSR